MDIVGLTKTYARRALRKAGMDVHRYAHTLPAVRSRLLSDLGVGVVLDVGANTGQYARSLRDAGYRGKIISFEPLADAFAQIAISFARDSNWRGMEVALGEDDGEATIHVAANSVSSSLLAMAPTHLAAAPASRVTRTETVAVARLDSLADKVLGTDQGMYLKIDTQGSELSVLRGATQTLKRTVAVESELSLVELYRGQPLLHEMITWLHKSGFAPVWLEKGLIHPDTGHLLQIDGVFVRSG